MYRSDPVEISAGGPDELNDVADVLLYFCTPPGNDLYKEYVLVRYYTVVQNEHPVMKVPYLRKRDPAKRDSYGCLELETITGHAHVVPDFDCTTKGYFFWDLVQ